MKRKSPVLALMISLTPNIAFFFLLFTSLIAVVSNYTVLSWPIIGLVICCLVTDGYGQFYNREYRKGLEFLAWAALSGLGRLTTALWFIPGILCIVPRFACGAASAIDAYRSAKRINE